MMSHETILRRTVAAGLTALMLVGCVSGCADGELEASSDGSSKEQDELIAQDMTKGLGQKIAPSLKVHIEQTLERLSKSQQLKDLDPTGEATARITETLERAKENGGISVSDYENAWNGYKQCMLNRGYKEIILIKASNGIYKEAGHRVGTSEQDGRYATDMLECGILYTADINGIYSTQIGNPNLYSNDYEAALDCMHREGAAPMDYSLDDLKYDMYERPHDGEPIIDLHSPAAASCLIANGINMASKDEPLEELW